MCVIFHIFLIIFTARGTEYSYSFFQLDASKSKRRHKEISHFEINQSMQYIQIYSHNNSQRSACNRDISYRPPRPLVNPRLVPPLLNRWQQRSVGSSIVKGSTFRLVKHTCVYSVNSFLPINLLHNYLENTNKD